MAVANIKLYKLLVKLGATEQEAEEVSSDIVESKILNLDKRFMQQEIKLEKLDTKIDKLDNKINNLQQELRTKFNLMVGICLMTLGSTLATLVSIIVLIAK